MICCGRWSVASAQGLMSPEADVICGAPWGQQSPERVNRPNGYRTRRWEARVGSIELRIPKLRRGSYFPEWVLDARTRSERAFVQVVTEAWVRGISTRWVEGLVEAAGVTSLSKSQVSELARELDQTVAEFRNRPVPSKRQPPRASIMLLLEWPVPYVGGRESLHPRFFVEMEATTFLDD